ncbi:C39 family peptidase [bacterium]|nr:C39 family peptidase [bacterium]MBU1652591.1 C39 family peptidase [bacterium]MBU1880517.1 C39 family peptidase [bacterium]
MSLSWTRRERALRGSRWKIYTEQVKNHIPIAWEEFKEEVVKHNPCLSSDGWIFKPDREYLLPECKETLSSKHQHVIRNVPCVSQLDNPHTDSAYWASDPDRRDETPDGCWMNELPDGGSYGQGAKNCPGPRKKGCIRPGSCNVTSLYMLLCFFDLTRSPAAYPDGAPLSSWLRSNRLSPTWLYVYMMDYWGKGQQLWDGIHPASAYNSIITARGDFLKDICLQFTQGNGGGWLPVYQPSVTLAEFQRAIDQGSPALLNSSRMKHVILGIGYTYKFDEPYVIAHDPYGRKNINLTRWKAYNRCGEKDQEGKAVTYRFSRLDPKYMIYFKKSN